MADIYVHEFLFRGKPDGTTEIHMYLAGMPVDPFTGEELPDPVLKGPLTIQEAADLGHALPDVLEAINQQVANELTTAWAENATLRARIAELTSGA